MKKVSLQFIADKANVSKSLVSKLLNNKEVRVSDATKKKVLEIASKYSYTPNRMAAGLRTKKTNIIGCLLPGIDSDFFAELAYAIESTAQAKGYQTIICNTKEDIQLERKYLELFRSGMMDGMIINPSDNDANLDMFRLMKKEMFPFIFVDRYIGNLGADFVVSDGFYGGFCLTEELIRRGHRRILLIYHDKAINTSVQIERFEGYKEAMLKNNLEVQHLIIDSKLPLRDQAVYQLFASPDRPTGIVLVASWDINLVLKMFAELSITIPTDCELATFDRFSISYSSMESMQTAKRMQSPPIIAEQNPIQMGETAFNMIYQKINNDSTHPQKLFVRPQIINL